MKTMRTVAESDDLLLEIVKAIDILLNKYPTKDFELRFTRTKGAIWLDDKELWASDDDVREWIRDEVETIDQYIEDHYIDELVTWVPFHFESNQAFGMCKTPEEWRQRKTDYCAYHKTLDPAKARQATYGKEGHHSQFRPNFGFRGEHVGNYTLADFARDNCMEL
ncbi:MAG: hypothetical protein KAS32_23380 [Candidatus Peribacteraceae bacterium]|nr:hypothetical protein [Candidatus Peribacteraceae bacterium]